MAAELTPDQLAHFLAVARRAAKAASRDEEVVEGAANYAVTQLVALLDTVSPEQKKREGWVSVVARNDAKRHGAKLHREHPFGKSGSFVPHVGDKQLDQHIKNLIVEMHRGARFSSLVANRIVFDQAWQLLNPETRALLEEKYVKGTPTRAIADARGLAPGTVDNKLTQAKASARLAFQDVYDDLSH